MLNYNHLYYFYIAAKAGGITAAAKILKVSQPSLSSQLKVLEGTLDLSLFRKVGRHNELTESGLLVYGFCRRMFEVSDELSELVMERLPSVSRKVNVGVSDQIERSFVAEIISSFLKKHGNDVRPRVSVVSEKQEYLCDRLKFRELDIIVTQLPLSDPDLSNLEHVNSPVCLFGSKSAGVGIKKVSLSDGNAIQKLVGGIDAHWIKPLPSTKLRAETDLFFEQHEIKGRVVFESDLMTTLTRSVVDGIGFAFLPKIFLTSEQINDRNLMQLGPKKGYWSYKIWLGCHGQNREDPLIKSFTRSFLDVSNGLHLSR